MKSSLRRGRFKKKLVTQSELEREASLVREEILAFYKLMESGKLSSVEFVGSFILIFLHHRFPHHWLGARRGGDKISGYPWRSLPFGFSSHIKARLKNTESLLDIFSEFNLKSTPEAVNRALLGWQRGEYDLELMFRIPLPREVLLQQAQGKRCVTAIIDERLSTFILGERDALSFLFHDLIHGDNFFSNKECHRGQLGFYGLLLKTFDEFDLSHKKFYDEFEYLISDMNAYAVHLLKCLKSAMTHYFGDGFFLKWCQKCQAPRALYLLNTSEFEEVPMSEELLGWLDQFSLYEGIKSAEFLSFSETLTREIQARSP